MKIHSILYLHVTDEWLFFISVAPKCDSLSIMGLKTILKFVGLLHIIFLYDQYFILEKNDFSTELVENSKLMKCNYRTIGQNFISFEH